ncbi:HAD family hydrolase [Metaplanococcus flavidus]|uniref:Phosphoserine phosphatase n=1 Tax=Metaplanococcus flavidus TaxID=569883 RepID=A0ABW3L8K9_9BACL
MIKTILFDLDDTLLWDKRSVAASLRMTCEYAEAVCGVDASLLEQSIRSEAAASYSETSVYEFTQSIGINPFEGLWGVFDDAGEQFQTMKKLMPEYRRTAWTRALKKSGIDDGTLGQKLSEHFPMMRAQNPLVFDETFQVLDQLKDRFQLMLLTNGSPSLQQTKLTMTPEIAPYFDDIIVSGAFGIGKPDTSIFDFAVAKSGHLKSEAIMVGDNLMTDILGANRSGIKSVWLNRDNQTANASIVPDFEIHGLDELIPLLENL